MPQTESLRSVEEMAPEAWRALARARIYFGHQSVGANVLEGVSELLAATPAIPLVVEPYAGAGPVAPGALAHGRVGRNLDYTSKIDAFAELVDGELAGRVDIAFFKFCYIDITPDTDVGQVFRRYTETMAELAARHPEITFMHSTVPLTLRLGPPAAVVRALKTRVQKILGLPTYDIFRNANRNRLNAMLRRHYEGREPLFDIARIESTRADGSRCAWKDGTRYAMVPEYTDDGGHLNARGRRWVAEQLLIQLAELADAG